MCIQNFLWKCVFCCISCSWNAFVTDSTVWMWFSHVIDNSQWTAFSTGQNWIAVYHILHSIFWRCLVWIVSLSEKRQQKGESLWYVKRAPHCWGSDSVIGSTALPMKSNTNRVMTCWKEKIKEGKCSLLCMFCIQC